MNYICVPGIKEKYRSESAPVITPEKIITTVCDYFVLSVDVVKSKSRAKEHVYARHVIFYFLRKHTNMTLKSSGALFNRDHTTVIHGLDNLRDIMDTEPVVRSEVELLETTIKNAI